MNGQNSFRGHTSSASCVQKHPTLNCELSRSPPSLRPPLLKDFAMFSPKPNSPPARPMPKDKTRLSGNHIFDSETSICLAERIAEGGQGQVYRATDSAGTDLAVKVLDRPYNSHLHATILNEIKIWSAVSDDPLVPTLRRVIEDDSFVYLVSVCSSNIGVIAVRLQEYAGPRQSIHPQRLYRPMGGYQIYAEMLQDQTKHRRSSHRCYRALPPSRNLSPGHQVRQHSRTLGRIWCIFDRLWGIL